ncbi:MAG: TrmH family RNA methyltransferase [Ignavibacteriaceae bacterium]|nr:TrmH family RNA methyltransferase [Ignavibacteriaceae bacterium]
MRKLTYDEIKSLRLSETEALVTQRNPISVLCDNIRSIFNVGAIFRTSDAILAEKIWLTGYTPYPPRKEIEKVALGATRTVHWEYVKNPIEVIDKLKSFGVKIAVLEQTNKRNTIWDVKTDDFPICLVLGNEISGVAEGIIRRADLSYEIPMFGFKQSLNVSVAFGIAAYSLLRKLKDDG